MANDELSTTDRLLALLLVHDMHDASQKDKIVMLGRAGIPNGDIAELLGTTAAVVSQSIYAGKQSKRTSKNRARRK